MYIYRERQYFILKLQMELTFYIFIWFLYIFIYCTSFKIIENNATW